ATSVDRDTYADQPSKSAEVSNCAFLPKKRIRGRVPGYRRDTGHRGSIVKSIGRAERSAQRGEDGEFVMMMLAVSIGIGRRGDRSGCRPTQPSQGHNKAA